MVHNCTRLIAAVVGYTGWRHPAAGPLRIGPAADGEVEMDPTHSFDIAFLGLRDASQIGRTRMVNAMERLTGRSTAECQELVLRTGLTIFDSLPADQAQLIFNALDDAGVICELRPRAEAARAATDTGRGMMTTCPSCGFVQPAGTEECSSCGVVFSKMERDEVRKMQSNQALEEAVARAEQVKQEWDDRAKQFIQSHALPPKATEPFEEVLTQEEIPFLLLTALEGPILMTSRQVLALVDGEHAFLPYEIIKDVDYGGGLVVKKNHTRLLLHFHTAVPFKGKNIKSMTWQLDTESAKNKETILDWAFARSYICGSCGARDMDFRTDKGQTYGRCMHCATDHIIDLRHHRVTPLMS
jgi:hypothetical protein